MARAAVTYQPGPTSQRRRLPYHSEQDMLELEARAGIYANGLPSSPTRGQVMDGWSGQMLTPEQTMRGWTAQQPWVHVDCPVMHLCILCAHLVDPDYLRDHARDCAVAKELVS